MSKPVGSKRRVVYFVLVAFFGVFTICGSCLSRYDKFEDDGFHDDFEDDGATDLVRDNYMPYGWFYDETDMMPQFDGAIVVHFGKLYDAVLDDFLVYEGHTLYQFTLDDEKLPINLKPNGQNNDLTFALTQGYHVQAEITNATVKMDPDVILLPVYTWRFVSGSGYGVYVNETMMKYAYDRASGTKIPDEFVDKYWARSRVDQIWSQCKIQFRHMQHTEVTVPDCWAGGIEYRWPLLGRCHGWGCTVGQDVTEDELNQCVSPCLVRHFIKHNNYYVDGAINIYYFASLALYAEDYGVPIPAGVQCFDWVFLNDAGRSYDSNWNNPGRTIAHEIGHILMNSTEHTAGTLMAGSPESETYTLTEEQCIEARTANPEILSSAL